MPELRFEDKVYQVDDFDTVLNTLLKNGHAVPNFCRSGICHSCMMKAEEGEPLAFTQIGLGDELVAEKHFLTCQCAVYAPMTIRRPDKDKRTRFVAMVRDKQQLAEGVIRLQLSPEHEFAYQAGQYTTLINVDGLRGDFAIASVHGEGSLMTFHIADDPQQPLNRYILSELEVGDALEVQTALGDCFYRDSLREQDLLLVAVDTGLAGALSVAEQAVRDNPARRIEVVALQAAVSSEYFSAARHAELTAADSVPVSVLPLSASIGDDLGKRLDSVGDSTSIIIAALDEEVAGRIAAMTDSSDMLFLSADMAGIGVAA